MALYWRKNPVVSCRREFFGGILFHRERGIMLELDREAHRLFELCDGTLSEAQVKVALEAEFGRTFTERALARMRAQLAELGMIVPASTPAVEEDCVAWAAWPAQGPLTAPVTVHWAITYRCDSRCPYCYVERGRAEGEMGGEEVRHFVELLAQAGVFQLAIGGGEPFLRPDLPEVVAYAHEQGIVPSITTNGLHLDERILEKLAGKIGRLQISFDTEERLDRDRGEGTYRQVYAGIQQMRAAGIPLGINFLVTRESVETVEEPLAFFAELGAAQVTILRPKPAVLDVSWCTREMPIPEQYRELRQKLTEIRPRFPRMVIHVDCALSFLMGDVPPSRLVRHGVYGCAAGERFLVVLPNGDAYPCSHCVAEEHFVGNILRDDFAALWNSAKALADFRKFRHHPLFLRTGCGQCQARQTCGGCRAIAEKTRGDFLREDEGCFHPVEGAKRPCAS